MNIAAGEIYHIYNQGNNKEIIFHIAADYLEFLRLFRRLLFPHCKVLAYCLMPNHFHFLIYATEDAASVKKVGNINSCVLANGFRLLQSNYAQYFNQSNNRSGSLFRQKAKAKPVVSNDICHQVQVFMYIHQNPLQAGIVNKLEDWHYSSFNDYTGARNGTLCDRKITEKLLGITKENFHERSSGNIDLVKISNR
ncbi:MAG: hypothetical protein QM791_06395 [Ferruginibacter sp.]